MQSKQTAVEWLVEQLKTMDTKCFNRLIQIEMSRENFEECFEQAKEMEKEQQILLVERLMEYTKESQIVLGNDEREASEFVDIFYNETFKSE